MGLRIEGYDRSRTPPDRIVHHAFAESAWKTVGGVRSGRSNLTYPFATLTADAEWCRISTRRSAAGEGIWIGRSEVWQVRQVRGVGSPGVMFDAPDHRFDGVIFWIGSPSSVLGALQWFGWPVPPPGGPVVPADAKAPADDGPLTSPGAARSAAWDRFLRRAMRVLFPLFLLLMAGVLVGLATSSVIAPISFAVGLVVTLAWNIYFFAFWRPRFERRYPREEVG